MLAEIIAAAVVIILGVVGVGAFGMVAVGEIKNGISRKHA